MSNQRTCDREGCEYPATHRPVIIIYAVSNKLHSPSKGTLDLVVCREHATEASAQDLLNDAGKHQIELQFKRAGLARPDWGRSYVQWVRLE